MLKEYCVPVGKEQYDRLMALDTALGLPGPLVYDGLNVLWPPIDTARRDASDDWTASVRETDAAFVPLPPRPVTDAGLRLRALEQINAVADGLERAATARSLPDLVPTLEQVVTEACADLGFRLFLRAMKEYFVAIDENRCDAFTALGESFGYPEFLVDDNLNVG
ncbi:hypothetical protein [Streptomyces sp. NPDC003710]